MNWVLFALVFLGMLWAISLLWSPRRRVKAVNRLNNDGWPRGVTRDDHRRNDEE